MKTLIVNLFGGPGCGKSTFSASLFTQLKIKGIECEMALEYAKDLVWEESFKKIENQNYIFGKQQARLIRLLGKVQVVITDSPLLNSIVYYGGSNPHFEPFVMWEFNQMNNLNFYLERQYKYVENGRMQSLEEALEVDRKYKDLIDSSEISYYPISAGKDLDMAVEMIINKIFE